MQPLAARVLGAPASARVPWPLPREEGDHCRDLRLQQQLLYIAHALVDQHIGLDETDDGIWSIYFNAVLIATVNERDYIIRG